jgi:two-component system, LytTR family, sensor kinase
MIHSRTKTIILINVAIWFLFILLLTLFSFFWVHEDFLDSLVWAASGVVVFFCPITYFNSLFLIPQLLIKRRIFAYSLILVALLPLWTIATIFIDHYVFESLDIGGSNGDALEYLTSAIPYSFMTFFLLIATLINLSYRWFFQLQQIQAMEQAQISSELALLKAQINPHFFFNTLNNLYALALENSAKTPSTILILSNLMRYVIYDANAEKTFLPDEIKYIENYLALQKIRLRHPEKIEFKKEITFEKIMLPPLLLIVFIENAFKYSISTMAEESYIHLSLFSNEQQIKFTIQNNYDPSQAAVSNTGIGLMNARKRLDLIYGKKYELVINDQSGVYSVALILHLQ